jgi:hypothetical protein
MAAGGTGAAEIEVLFSHFMYNGNHGLGNLAACGSRAISRSGKAELAAVRSWRELQCCGGASGSESGSAVARGLHFGNDDWLAVCAGWFENESGVEWLGSAFWPTGGSAQS